MSADTRLRELLHEMAPAPDVDAASEAQARRALHAAFRDAARPKPSRHRRPSFAWATATVAAVVVAAALLLPGSSPSVDASLAQIARSTRQLDAAQLPAGSFVYSFEKSTNLGSQRLDEQGKQLLYLLPTTRELWVRGATEQRVTTVGTPVFFDAADEAAYYAAGLDLIDAVGETRTDRFGDVANLPDITKWSDDPAELRDQITAELVKGDPALGEDIRLVLLVEQLMNPSLNAPPGLRAALIEIVGSLKVATTEMADGSVRVRLEYEDPAIGTMAHELDFDHAGYLRARRQIVLDPNPTLQVPPNTAIAETTWSRPSVVDSPGLRPADR